MIIEEENYLAHYGIIHRSGRYPWGSGADPEQRSRDFIGFVSNLRKQGWSDRDIAQGMALYTENGKPWSSTDFRAASSIAKNKTRAADINMVERLKAKGVSNVEIGRRMGMPESSVRALLAPGVKDRADILQSTANMLKSEVDAKNYIDVGVGVENHLGVSYTRLKTALAMVQEEGYKVQYLKVRQLGTGKDTTRTVLTKPDVTYSELLKNRDNVQLINRYSDDYGRSYNLGMERPATSISSKRVGINYAEDGGKEADGVIYIRPGVPDLDMGKAHYAQVRIAVDDSHFLKGMAIYKNDLPDGVDVVFNTNKSNTGNKLDAMKPMKKGLDGAIDKDNPFGASISRQSGHLNIVNEEGDWDKWSRTLSSQFLSKQSPTLIKDQLKMTYEGRKNQLDEIMSMTNPTVRRKMLIDFSEDADAAAVHLKAAMLPRQSSHVIIPIKSLKESEVYAPNYHNGERVVLIRHPHAGTFEIPELVVNNRNREARETLGSGDKAAKDAIGIHHKVAERLSGADFDGDTVLVIPNNAGRVVSTRALEDLKNFDPRSEYPKYDGMPVMTAQGKSKQMGDISNLITDMTLKGASTAELARAVKHSMVVIDAEKHELNYRLSAKVNGIAALKEKYQRGPRSGASTLISQKKTEVRVPERKQGYRIDPATGRRIYQETGASFVGRKGEVVVKTTKVKKLELADDAHSLSSGTRREALYADYSNQMKALANTARKEAVTTKSNPISSSARKTYAKEVDSLKAKLNVALQNAPLERHAQQLANQIVDQKKQDYPDMDAATLKKIKGQALTTARLRVGAKKHRVDITDDEWTAIQQGAISNHLLTQVLKHADGDRVKELAAPRTARKMTASKQSVARGMLAAGYTQAEVAAHLGVSVSTLKANLSEGE